MNPMSTALTSTSRTESFANGLTLRIDERGTGSPMLVLHGGAGPQSVAGFAQAMSTDAHVLTPTHPGFAGEPRPDWFTSVGDLAQGYLDLLMQLDLRDVTVVGSSIGGWIAGELAARDASRLSRLILIDAAGLEVAGHEIADVFTLTPDQLSALSFHDPARFRVDPATITPEQIAARAANFQTLAVYAKDGMTDPGLRQRLSSVTTPVLVVWGESDGVIDPAYGRAYAEAFPNAHFELIPEAGHLPQIEQPERVLKLVRAFAESVANK
jgi:pimeloyl-ACP methyl ester carboxylesterase